MSKEFDHVVAMWVGEGLSFDDAETFAEVNIDPSMVSCPGEYALAFASAAGYRGLDDFRVAALLKAAKGDPDEAWQLWADDGTDD